MKETKKRPKNILHTENTTQKQTTTETTIHNERNHIKRLQNPYRKTQIKTTL